MDKIIKALLIFLAFSSFGIVVLLGSGLSQPTITSAILDNLTVGVLALSCAKNI